MKAAGGDAAIQSFNGYAAVTAYNACHEYFRARRPAWLSLANKVRYLATHSPEFALWEDDDGREVCGFASSRRQPPRSDAARLSEGGRRFRRQQDPSRVKIVEVVSAILKTAVQPLIFEELVDAAAEWTSLKEAQVMSLDQERSEKSAAWEPADRGTPAETHLIDRENMRRLWKEILELPLEHRKALLLNLDDSAGGDIQLFDALGIASISQIATALEMAPLEFAELWKNLPLDDASIAGRLGISRQDVANRRSSARKRLARRMLEFLRAK
jgi:DNA-directed RNA polymerase specialized sigma24 family protein